MLVREFMNANPVTCLPGNTLHTVAQQMWEHDLGCVPVVDDAGRLAGVITDRDITMACFTQGLPPQGIRVRDCMSRQLHTISADATLEQALGIMRERQVRRLPVAEGNTLLGMITIGDIGLHVYREKEAGRTAPEASAFIDTFAALCFSRKHHA